MNAACTLKREWLFEAMTVGFRRAAACRAKAEAVFMYFSGLEGNQHIASEYAINGLLRLLCQRRSAVVLEVGVGIGTLAYAVLDAAAEGILGSDFHYYGSEGNDYCIRELNQNLMPLSRYHTHFTLVADVDELFRKTERKIDFVVIDGKDPCLEAVIPRLSKNGCIFVEGDRRDQIEILRSATDRRHICQRSITAKANPLYSPLPGSYSGGYTVCQFEPSLSDRIRWFMNKINTRLAYKARSRGVVI